MKGKKLNRRIVLIIATLLSLHSLSICAFATGTETALKDIREAVIPVEKEMTEEEKTVVEFKAEVLRLVNIEREKVDLPPILALDKLAELSDLRALETFAKFSHMRPDGTNWFTVFGKYSLKYKVAGENLAYGFKTPDALVKAWMNSKGHKANILNPSYEYIGIGYYKDFKGKIYTSQLFYTPY